MLQPLRHRLRLDTKRNTGGAHRWDRALDLEAPTTGNAPPASADGETAIKFRPEPICDEFTRETQREQAGALQANAEGKQQMKSTAEWSGGSPGPDEDGGAAWQRELLWIPPSNIQQQLIQFRFALDPAQAVRQIDFTYIKRQFVVNRSSALQQLRGAEIRLTASVQPAQQPSNRSAMARTDDITVHHRGHRNPNLGNDSWPLERLGAMDAIGSQCRISFESGHSFIGPATEQKGPTLIGPGLLPQKGRQPRSFRSGDGRNDKYRLGRKTTDMKLLLQRPKADLERSWTIKPASPMQWAPPPERLLKQETCDTCTARRQKRRVLQIESSFDKARWQADEEIRTLDPLLGKEMLYH